MHRNIWESLVHAWPKHVEDQAEGRYMDTALVKQDKFEASTTGMSSGDLFKDWQMTLSNELIMGFKKAKPFIKTLFKKNKIWAL